MHRFRRLYNLLPTPRLTLGAQAAVSVLTLAVVARRCRR